MSQKPVPGAKKGRADPNPFQFDQGEGPQPADRPAAAASPSSSPPLRPTFLDYFLLLLGVTLSVYLVRISSQLPIKPRDPAAGPQLQTALSYALDFMRLTEGVILLGPLLLATQWLRGRRQGLTSIEWLWVLAWFGAAFLASLAALHPYLPATLLNLGPWMWYLIVVPSMAGLGVVLRLLGLFSRRPAPWTHALGLALLVWPVPLLAVVLAVGKYG